MSQALFRCWGGYRAGRLGGRLSTTVRPLESERVEESDSDDELSELYPLFSRYVQQHVGALTPKAGRVAGLDCFFEDRRGLTGGGRYFGQEKQQVRMLRDS